MVNFNFIRLPASKNIKVLTVIYDIAFEHFPQHTEKKNLQFLKKRVPQTVKKSDKIITISEATKQDLIATYNTNPTKIIVAPCAVDNKRFRRVTIKESIRKRYNLPNKYILHLGTIEPRKNIVGLIKAYDQLSDQLKQNYPLVLAGGKGWLDEEIDNAISKVKLPGKIIKTGYIDDKDVPAIYSGADLFVFPSFYEGFGLPPLEAMACGTPVITANNSSLPEVAGDAAILVDANNIKQLSGSITKALTDKKLAESMVKRGYKQVKKFSWAKSAKEILKAINEISKK